MAVTHGATQGATQGASQGATQRAEQGATPDAAQRAFAAPYDSAAALRGKSVLITGAASGLGAALAGNLARVGARIVATDIRAEALEQNAQAWRALGVRAHTIAFDVADPPAAQRAIGEAIDVTPFLLDRFPGLDPALLQDPADVAEAIRAVLSMPPETVIAEMTMLPMHETSWP